MSILFIGGTTIDDILDTEAPDPLKNFCDQIGCDCTDGGQLDDLFDGIGDQTLNSFQGILNYPSII